VGAVVTDAGGFIITVVTRLKPLDVLYAIGASQPLSRKSETGLGRNCVFVHWASAKEKMVIGPSKALCVPFYRNLTSMDFDCY
tara:strand:- start:70 stop:318 length:249 start_codon:yes stop_codon:yes gene_type:complete